MSQANVEALQYVGYARETGGILAVVRALAGTGEFRCVLGVGPGFRPKQPPLPALELPALAPEEIGFASFRRARAVAEAIRPWLNARHRVFHGRSRAGLLVAFWLRLLGERRVVATVHCLGRQRWFYRTMGSLLRDRLYWLGPAMKRYYGVPVDASDPWAQCLPDCVPLGAVASVLPVRHRSATIFGCVGACVPVKNWELVLRAAAEIPREMPIRFVHAGGEDDTAASAAYAGELRRIQAELGLAGRFEWRGHVEDLSAFWREIDCLIVASRWEAFSMAALEAAAAGVPVLAPDASGTADLVASGGGWLFPADSAAGLATTMARLVGTGELGRWQRDERLLARFLAPTVAAQHRRVYQQLLAR